MHRVFRRELLFALLLNVVCVFSYWTVAARLPVPWVGTAGGSLLHMEFSVFLWSAFIAMLGVEVWVGIKGSRANRNHPLESHQPPALQLGLLIIAVAVAMGAVLSNEVLLTTREVVSKVCFCTAGFVLTAEGAVLLFRVGRRAEVRGGI